MIYCVLHFNIRMKYYYTTVCLVVLGLCGNWIEIAYGTSSGTVRVIVQHPETVGHGPQLFQTFTVHQSSVTKVSEHFLHYFTNTCKNFLSST